MNSSSSQSHFLPEYLRLVTQYPWQTTFLIHPSLLRGYLFIKYLHQITTYHTLSRISIFSFSFVYAWIRDKVTTDTHKILYICEIYLWLKLESIPDYHIRLTVFHSLLINGLIPACSKTAYIYYKTAIPIIISYSRDLDVGFPWTNPFLYILPAVPLSLMPYADDYNLRTSSNQLAQWFKHYKKPHIIAMST